MIALQADCSRCFALCCTALPFARSADFAIDKAAGVPCPNLAEDYHCRVHRTLVPLGFSGCASFDCFGAGQRVSQTTYSGVSWRQADAGARFASFDVMRRVHELLWYLADVRRRAPADEKARALVDQLERRSAGTAAELAALELDLLRVAVDEVLTRISEQVRSAHPDAQALRGRDLIGRRLTDLRGAQLRGALLIGADLSDQDLTDVDLLGADLRGADLRGADLTGVLFLTQTQLNAARGNGSTRVPEHVVRPPSWP